ncbi:MAG TPA: energy transducer TonB [Caldimonas sp.]|jgi:protein TonB|nr:energy transducer TonB [Caldimonas sp.]HEX4235924.1 energy transducer TonB [Caldimonas sp.]
MNFAQQQADPRRRIVGFGAVLLFHALLIYALVTGLAKKVVDVVRAPIETKVIEEVKKPPPPPEVVVPPPPKLEAPPPPFIPPPEIQIANPPPAPTITATTPTPPPAPVTITPAPPPVVAAAPAPAPAVAAASVVCSNYNTVMGEVAFPREATRQGIDRGDATIQFTLSPSGEMKDIKALSASNQIFARNSIRIVSAYKCKGQGRDVTVTVPFSYKLE